jgi:heat shock protein HslJ
MTLRNFFVGRAIGLIILLVLVGVFFGIKALVTDSTVESVETAIALVKEEKPELAEYPSENLPPKRIQSDEAADGWFLGFLMEGSGRSGILKGECYFVSKTGKVESRGVFVANEMAGPNMLYLTDCTPVVAENPDGEADPSRMTLSMKKWEWVKALYNDGRTITPKKAGVFTVTFREDGTFSATTDCNGIGGKYTAKDGVITFDSVFITEMYCEGSQDTLFARLVGDSTSYHFTGRGELIFDLKYDSGTVVFR